MRHAAGDVRLGRDPRADDETEAGVLNGFLVRCGHHSRVRDDRDVRQLVGDHERLDRRDHRERLGLVALERLEQERESAVVGQQPDRDLWFEAAFLGEPRLPEPVTLIGFKVESGHVVQHQARRSEACLRGARCRDPAPELAFRVTRQSAIDRRVRGRGEAGLLQDPDRVELGARFDDPRQDQLPEHLIPARGLGEPEPLVHPGQRITQMSHPRRADRQRAPRRDARAVTDARRHLEAKVQNALASGQSLPCSDLEDLDLGVRVSRTDMLDVPRTAPVRVHDLYRGRP